MKKWMIMLVAGLMAAAMSSMPPISVPTGYLQTETPVATHTPTVVLNPIATRTSYLPLVRRSLANKILAMDAAGNYAYIGRTLYHDYTGTPRGTMLTVLDISDPPHPVELGSVRLSDDIPSAVQVEGDIVYVTAGALFTVDVSDPFFPRVLGHIGDEYGTLVLGHQSALVSWMYCWLEYNHWGYSWRCKTLTDVLDVSDPENPYIASSWEGLVLAVLDDYAISYARVEEDLILRVIDISDLTAPAIVGQIDFPPGSEVSYGFVAFGDVAYLAGSIIGVYDVSTLPSIELIGSFRLPGTSLRIRVKGQRAYVFRWMGEVTDNFLILDISNPMAPVELGTYTVPEWRWSGKPLVSEWMGEFAVSDHYVFTLGGSFFRILDVSDPTNIVEVGRYYVP